MASGAASERVQSTPLGDRKQTAAQIKAVGVVRRASHPLSSVAAAYCLMTRPPKLPASAWLVAACYGYSRRPWMLVATTHAMQKLRQARAAADDVLQRQLLAELGRLREVYEEATHRATNRADGGGGSDAGQQQQQQQQQQLLAEVSGTKTQEQEQDKDISAAPSSSASATAFPAAAPAPPRHAQPPAACPVRVVVKVETKASAQRTPSALATHARKCAHQRNDDAKPVDGVLAVGGPAATPTSLVDAHASVSRPFPSWNRFHVD
jgi:hypothetical protein